MNTSLKAGILLGMTVLILGLAQTACRGIPNDDLSANLKLVVDVPGAPAVTDPAPPTVRRLTDADEVTAQAGATAGVSYHVKVSLTNPDETFFIYNYKPGSEASLTVSSGEGRELRVEVYMIYDSAMGFTLPAMHFKSDQVQVLDLHGEPVVARVLVSENMNLGSIHDYPPPPPTLLVIDGYTIGLPAQNDCPPAFSPAPTYMAKITDDDWGLTFPKVEVASQYGSTLNFDISGLPMNHTFTFYVFHSEAGIWSQRTVTITQPSQAVDFNFKGATMLAVKKNTTLDLSAVTPLSLVDVPFKMTGGLGGYMPYNGMSDTCHGSILGDVYEFMAPAMGLSCVIHIVAEDCTGATDDLILNVTAKAPATPRTFYVAKSGNDANPGTQAAPFLTIGRALDASYTGDTIKVAKGVYNESFVYIDFGVNLKGGFNPANWNRDVLVFRTVLQGDGSSPGFLAEMAMGPVTIDGFIIQNHNQGIGNFASTVTVSNNIITNNQYGVDSYAGSSYMGYVGMANVGARGMAVTPDSSFYPPTVTTLSHNLLVRNYNGVNFSSHDRYGKIGCSKYDYSCTLYNCMPPFESNTPPDCPNGSYIGYGQSYCFTGYYLSSCSYGYYIYGCDYGTGSLTSVNNTFYANNYYGIRADRYSDYYCDYGYPVSASIRNDIFANNNYGDVYFFRISNDIQYSLFEGGSPSGGTLLNHSPIFADPTRWGQLLLEGDPAINAGDPAAAFNDPDGTRNDMGWEGGNSIWYDSDHDGMPNSWENRYGLNPNNHLDGSQDNDSDGLNNFQEFAAATSPVSADTDGDGMPDAWEATYFNCMYPWLNDATGNPDGDAYNNLQEFNNVPKTDPCTIDP